ncbi:MAG: LysM peptidoglycan-binding domain-containing protein [Anaerolineae bacterium]
MKRVLLAAAAASLLVGMRAAQAEVYTVQYGDTLVTIAARYGITAGELAATNGITNPDRLAPGQVLALPAGAAPRYEAGGSVYLLTHVVQPGEFLKQIAEQYGVEWETLLALNQRSDPNQVYAGDQLTVMIIDRTQDTSRRTPLPVDFMDSSLIWLAYRHEANIAAIAAYNGLPYHWVLEGVRVTVPPNAVFNTVNLAAVIDSPQAAVVPTAPSVSGGGVAELPPTPRPDTTQTPGASDDSPWFDPSDDWTPYPLPGAVGYNPGDLEVIFSQPLLQEGGAQVRIEVTVRNISLEQGIASGWYYFGENDAGGQQWVSLLGVKHEDVPVAKIDTAPLWQAKTTMSDGEVWTFPVGCVYMDVLHYEGFEPTGPNGEGYHWTVHDESGFYDCGNGYQVKREEDLYPGDEWTMPLIIYLSHPKEWALGIPFDYRRSGERIEFGLWRADGEWLGTVHTVTY